MDSGVSKPLGSILLMNSPKKIRPQTTTGQPSYGEGKDFPRKVFQCSSCGTYYEDWNLFLHMRAVHNRFICLLCLGLFPNAKRLARHLGSRHELADNNFRTISDLMAWNENRPCHMMCVNCENVFEESTVSGIDNPQPVAHSCCNSVVPQQITSQCPTDEDLGDRKSGKRPKRQDFLSSNIVASPSGVKLKIKGLNSNSSTLSDNAGNRRPNSDSVPSEVVDTGDAFSFKFILSKNGLVQNPNARKFETAPVDSRPIDNEDQISDPIDEVHSEEAAAAMEIAKSLETTELDQFYVQPPAPTTEPSEVPPLLVSKLKLKIPKFIVPVDTDEEDDDDDVDDEDENKFKSSGVKEEHAPSLNIGQHGLGIKKELTCDGLNTSTTLETREDDNTPPLLQPEQQGDDDVKGEKKTCEALSGPMGATPGDCHIENSDDGQTDEPGCNIVEADVNSQLFELALDQPLDQIPAKDFLRICLRATIPFCLYCYHARRIAVNAKMLAIHMITMHRFTALVDSITAEELLPDTIVVRLRGALTDLEDIYFNLDDYDSEVVAPIKMKAKIFECFQCRFTTGTHKELYLHNRKLHLKTVLLCLMCKATFYNYSELLCHICPGVPSRDLNYDLRFRCYYCNINDLPSAFRLMVHLRKAHAVCEVCLEENFDQTRLSNHAWKHKLHHFCYRCGIAYRNKQDITRHLFWRHGCESVLCKKCLQKRWPHIYHFCLPPMQFNCDQCVLTFNRAVHLRVHKRLHTEEKPHLCAEEGCAEKFISHRMLEKHTRTHLGLLDVESEVVEIDEANENGNGLNVAKEEIIGSIDASGDHDNEDSKTSDPIMDLPVPNLSESDSSDDENELGFLLQGARMKRLSSSDEDGSDDEPVENTETTGPKKNIPELATDIASVDETTATDKASTSATLPKENKVDDSEDEDGERTKTKAIIDIWENFRSYQATQVQQHKHSDEDEEDLIAPLPPPILHVLQSDHDYACMYKVFGRIDDDQDLQEIQDIEMMRRSGKLYKRPGPHSDGSSCSCGSNCTCSSSNSSSSSGGSSSSPSTSSSSSDSSSDEGVAGKTKKPQRQLRKAKKKHGKKKGLLGGKEASDKDNLLLSINDEVVTRLPETDLETQESDTDEEFYDSNPYKIAQQRLAEKVKLEEDEASERRSRKERRRRHKRAKRVAKLKELEEKTGAALESRLEAAAAAACSTKPKHNLPNVVPPLKLNFSSRFKRAGSTSSNTSWQRPDNALLDTMRSHSQMLHNTPTTNISQGENRSSVLHALDDDSSSSSSNVKRSKRRRIPNRFYGYSSDDESLVATGAGLSAVGGAAFRPTAPPNLTWDKEDLPSPSGGGFPFATSTGMNNRSNRMSVDSKLDSLDFLGGSHRAMKTCVIDNKRDDFNDGFVIMKKKTKTLMNDDDLITHGRAPTPKRSFFRDSWTPRGHAEEEEVVPARRGQHTQLASQLQPTVRINTPEPVPRLKIRTNKGLTTGQLQPIAARVDRQKQHPTAEPKSQSVSAATTDLYCTCRRPYVDEVEMIACDGEGCRIEWFHFECVGILMAPQGKWFCAECSLQQQQRIRPATSV